MSRIPLESSESTEISPASLASLATPPVFIFGTASRRLRREFDGFIAARWRYYSTVEFRAELRRGMKTLLPPEEAERNVGLLDNWWTAQDDYADAKAEWQKENEHWKSEHEGEELPEDRRTYPEFDFPDHHALLLLTDNIRAQWEPLQVMAEANLTRNQMHSRAMIAFTLQSWQGIDLKPVRDAKGRLTMDFVDALEDALAELVGEALAEVAMSELTLTAMQRIYLLKDLEKNLPSPPPSTLSLSDTTTEQPDPGASPESAISSETPSATSAPTSES